MSINGTHLLSKTPIGAARGFFDIFYRLNAISSRCCVASSSSSIPNRHTNSRSSTSFRNARRSHSTTSSPSLSPSPSPSKITPTQEPPLSTTLRHLMRHLPHSVVVLTTSTSPPSNPETTPSTPKHVRKGMTLSSFTTLTLTPTPIITFNIRKPSQTLSALKQTRFFLVHILNGTVEGARVADRFTKGNTEGLWEGLKVEDVDVGEEGIICPRILDGDGDGRKAVGKVLVCEVEGGREGKGFVEVGDHVVVVAGVSRILGDGGEIDGDGEYGLCYVDGSYRGVGGIIDVHGKTQGVETVGQEV